MSVRGIWIKTYLITFVIVLLFTGFMLDGGVLSAVYAILSVPSLLLSWYLSNKDKVAKRTILAILIPLLTLMMALVVIEFLNLSRMH